MTNYLSPQDFDAFINSLRQVLTARQKNLEPLGRKLSMPIEGFVELFRLAYGSGLRISETLQLTKDDIDFAKKIIKIRFAKTGWKKCKDCKGYGCRVCDKLGKIRKTQYTTLHPNYADSLRVYMSKVTGPYLFATNRVTLWSLAKKAGNEAGLHVFEQQKERMIEGVWTHLFRKSRAQQMMLDRAADETTEYVYELVKIKLRHATEARDVTQHYTNFLGKKLTIMDLLAWEGKHYAP